MSTQGQRDEEKMKVGYVSQGRWQISSESIGPRKHVHRVRRWSHEDAKVEVEDE